MRWGVLMLEFDCGLHFSLLFFYCSRQKGPGGGNWEGHACRKLCMTHWPEPCSDFEGYSLATDFSSFVINAPFFSIPCTASQSVRSGAYTSHDYRVRHHNNRRVHKDIPLPLHSPPFQCNPHVMCVVRTN